MWDLLKVGFECGMCSKVFQMGLFGLKCIKGRNGRGDKKNCHKRVFWSYGKIRISDIVYGFIICYRIIETLISSGVLYIDI